MKRILLIVLLGMIGCATASANETQKPIVAGYFAEWSDVDARSLRGDLLTHLIYAFAKIDDGQCTVANPAAAKVRFEQFRALKQNYPQLQTLVAIGGWNGSAAFSDTALSDESRKKFADSCVRFIKQNGFDGIDIDW